MDHTYKKKKRFFLRIFIVIVSTYLLLEGLTYIFYNRYDAAIDWVLDKQLGHTGPKDKTVFVYGVESTYDEWGYRTRSEKEKASSLIVLGDSFTEANDIPLELTYQSLLRAKLEVREQKKINLVSLASADYGSVEPILAFHNRKPSTDAKMIVLQFLGFNDYVNNNIVYANKNESWSDFVRPYNIEQDPLNSPKIEYSNPILRYLLFYSSSFRAFYMGYTRLKWDKWMSEGAPHVSCSPVLQMFLKEPTEEWNRGLIATEGMFRKLVLDAENVPIVGVYFPVKEEIALDDWKRIKDPIERCFPGKESDQLLGEKRFIEIATKVGIPSFSLRHSFMRHEDLHSLYQEMGGHLNQKGHAFAAEKIFEVLPKSN
ncbi:MAG: hypothetical protein M9962_04150 [Oligoflexia bacterium]|nr:hypothetical protein [Oligoflexia bacterium]